VGVMLVELWSSSDLACRRHLLLFAGACCCNSWSSWHFPWDITGKTDGYDVRPCSFYKAEMNVAECLVKSFEHFTFALVWKW